MSNTTIDEKKLAEAKEKLACHIEPPKPRTEIRDDGRVLLTQMTAAGG